MTMMVGSRRISWRSASLIAWRIDFCGMADPSKNQHLTQRTQRFRKGRDGKFILSVLRVSFATLCVKAFLVSIRHVDVCEQRTLRRRCRLSGDRDGALDQRRDLGVDRVERIHFQERRLADPAPE